MTKRTQSGFLQIENSVDIKRPLLYRIWVKPVSGGEEITIYVGQSRNGAARPFQRYDLNIRRLNEGKSALNGRGYRPVHYDLQAAQRGGHEVGIELVRNVDVESPQLC